MTTTTRTIITADSITDRQIRALGEEAAVAGDAATTNLCRAALGLAESWMVDEARAQVAAILQAAADMED